jgi:heme exporter protein C
LFSILLFDIPFCPIFAPTFSGPVSYSGHPMIDTKNYMHKSWWKIASIVLLFYTFIGGFLLDVPHLPALQETIRNLYFHVCMWFGMMILFSISVVNSIRYLRTFDLKYDIYARQYATMGILMGVLGYATGTLWMLFTWADPNTLGVQTFSTVAREPKLIGAAIALLIYFAYMVLRDSVNDIDKRARISSVYNIFAYAMLFPSIWIIPRILPSLHPGQTGNPALDMKDIDNRMRLVFYPAVLGWTLLGVWITTLKIRINLLKEKKMSS